MKHLKTYEENVEPQIGDYVIVKVNYYNIKYFVNTHVGKIIDIVRIQNLFATKIKYDNIPENLKKYFDNNGVFTFHLSDIKHFSKSKENLQTKIATKKYNL